MMNKLDIKFNNLIDIFKLLSKEKILENIKDTYLKIDNRNKQAIESFLKMFNYWGKLDYANNEFTELERRATVLKNHANDFMTLYDSLGDYRSKQVILGILNYWYNNDFIELDKARENNFSQYFDLDLLDLSADEVFVDVGAYIGDTIKSFIENYGKYEKIYGYEITMDSIKTMQEALKDWPNIVIRKKALGISEGELYIQSNENSTSANKINNWGEEKVTCVTLDDDIKEKISIIKMDIEGSEGNALMGAINHIKNDTPKLLISVYHNHDDLWRIPKLITTINDNYRFYLRYFGNKYYPTEVVLIALPT